MKLKINKILFASIPSIIGTSLVVSCNNKQAELKFRESNKLELFEEYRKIFKEYYFNGNEENLNKYILEQKNLDSFYKDEVNASLIITPPFAPNVKKGTPLAQKSIKTINEALKNNSLWFLLNLNNFQFVYNSYGDEFSSNQYSAPKNVEKDFSAKMKNPGIIIKKIINLPSSIITKEFDQLPEDSYKNKKLHYLVFENNVIPIFTAQKIDNNENIFFILPTIITFSTLVDFNDSLEKMHLELMNQRKEIVNQYIKTYGDSENEEKLKKDKNDSNFFSLYAKHNYQLALKKILEESDGQITKYTWGFINEE